MRRWGRAGEGTEFGGEGEVQGMSKGINKLQREGAPIGNGVLDTLSQDCSCMIV